jgi:predicted amidohydrolase YtcJ
MFISGDDMFKKVLNKALNYYDDFDYLTNALCVFSKNIPYATGDESLIGTLELGKFADMAILDREIFHVSLEDILNIKVERTMLAGKDTWIRK